MADDDTTTGDGGQADTGQGTDARLDRLESKQAEQDGKLDRILELLPGRSGDGAGDDAGAAAPDIQSQVRKEIAETKAREEAEARAKGHAEWMQSVEEKLEKLKPEKTPREAQTGWRGKLQRTMFGKPDD